MSYRELPAPAALRDLAECVWVNEGPRQAWVLPDGCMDLIEMNDAVLIAGPDTTAFLSDQHSPLATGIRFRPGALPRLLGVPAGRLLQRREEIDRGAVGVEHGRVALPPRRVERLESSS